MKFLAITLITHQPDHLTGVLKPTTARLREVVDNAVLAEEERSSALVGSPQQIIEKVHRYHDRLGHEVMHLHADADGLTEAQHRETLELFQSDIAPVLRREIPSRPFPVPPARDATDSGPTAG
jgi:alkanesulfonate monooxygenase SsuD/methylene tetrahydromethanopterin reductase-like flavin-dependent oxidoreductase (luciferase family)